MRVCYSDVLIGPSESHSSRETTKYNFHNLDRAKNQFKLVDAMSENFEKMNNIALAEFIKLKGN